MGEYTSNANIQSRETMRQANEQQSELFRALMQQRAAQQMQQQAAQQAMELAKYRDTLGAEGQKRNIGALEDLIARHPNMGASIAEGGNVSLTRPVPDPMIHQQQLQAAEASKVYQMAGKTFKPLQDQVNAHQKILDDVSQGTELGDKGAMVGLARVQEGQGQRLLQSIVQSMAGKSSSINTAQDAMNWLSNNPQSRLGPDQRDMIKSYVVSRVPSLKQQYQDAVAQTSAVAPGMAPHVPNAADVIGQIHAPVGSGISRLDQFSQEYAKTQPKAPPATMEAPNKTQAPMDRFLSYVGLSRAKPQPPAAGQMGGSLAPYAGVVPTTQPQAAPATDPATVAKMKRLQELKAKEAGQ